MPFIKNVPKPPELKGKGDKGLNWHFAKHNGLFDVAVVHKDSEAAKIKVKSALRSMKLKEVDDLRPHTPGPCVVRSHSAQVTKQHLARIAADPNVERIILVRNPK